MKINMKSKSVTLATKGCYCPEDVEVAAILQEKTVTANGDAIPDEGYAGLGKVTVNVPKGYNTSDATATAAQILTGATAYVQGAKITGTIPIYDGSLCEIDSSASEKK